MTLPILSAALEHPGQLAYEDADTQLTYQELCATLEGLSAEPWASFHQGDHVAWCPENNAEALRTFWAIISRGCVACPLSHRFPNSTRNEILERIDACWLPSDTIEMGPRHPQDHPLPTSDADLKQPSTIILSSGSTGTPKAVVHSMAAHIASAEGAATNMPLLPGDRWLWSLPLCHISGLSIVIRCAVSGATIVGMPDKEKLTAGLLCERKITHLSVVATQLRRLLSEDNFPSPHLKFVLLGGSSIDPALVRTSRRRGIDVFTTYGLTEMASQVTTSSSNGAPEKSGNVLPGRELKIDDSGEIHVRGETLCLGYYRDGQVQSVVNERAWFLTGDLGSLDDSGQLTVQGRLDNMFISGGENIHPENIERAMMNAFGLQQVIVVPKPDDTFGARPFAFVDGKLPANWQTTLKSFLSGFEIPIEARAWPGDAKLAIKADRKQLQALVRSS